MLLYIIIDNELLLFRDLWDYMLNLFIEMNCLMDSIKEDLDKIVIYFKIVLE